MDPNQINQINQINQMNQMPYYQNYLINNENKLETQGNMNLLYNYQQYYKSAGRVNTNVNSIAGNSQNLQIANLLMQNSNTPIPQNSTGLIGVFPSNSLITDTPDVLNLNTEKFESEKDSNTDNSALSIQNFNIQNVPRDIPHDRQIQQEEGNRPWDKVSKDPSIIQKGTELFVGNLSLETTENDLYEAFMDCGEVIDIRVHKNHQNKNCYAFIRMLTKEMLKEALNKNMTILKGRKMKITKSNENSTIFIGNIRKNWKNSDIEAKVRRIFPNCEKIENFPDPINPTKNRGFCFVVFKNRNDAIKALNYVNNKGGINIDGVPLTCDWADVIDEDDNNSKQIFLSGLNDNINEETLKEIFAEYGRIENVILSREHKNSKRKDLAFITYNTHEEAKHANEDFKLRQDNKDSSIDVLGERIGISLAFSQQAMQNKKKIKESRRKPTVVVPGQIPIIVNKSATSNLTLDPRQQNSGNANISGLSNMFSNITANLPQNMLNTNTGQSVDLTSINPSNTNATALLTMMNLLNMNKNNMNINPALFNQMMSACLESMMSQNIQAGNTNILPQANTANMPNNPGIQNFNRLNNFNNLNPPTFNSFKTLNNFNTLPSTNQVSLYTNLNYPYSQIFNLGASKINNPKRTKKFNQKKSYNSNSFLNANNPNSA